MCFAARHSGFRRFFSKPSSRSNSATSVSAWGKKRLSVREAIFFSKFRGCLTAAKDALFR